MLKIGALSFINSLPFFQAFTEKKVAYDGQFSFGSPTEINALLEKGVIDIGLVSSASFIANRDRYILLTNLGIGATRRVTSVCLFSKHDPTALDKKKLAIPDSNATSVMLLKVLCRHSWHVEPEFVEVPRKTKPSTLIEKYDAALVIGDECLTTKINPTCRTIDLADAWFHFTGKPFIFAVFATRCDIWMQYPTHVQDFHRKLSLSYDYSQTNFQDLLLSANQKTGLSLDTLNSFYKAIDYHLETEHFQGLDQFARLYNAEPLLQRLS